MSHTCVSPQEEALDSSCPDVKGPQASGERHGYRSQGSRPPDCGQQRLEEPRALESGRRDLEEQKYVIGWGFLESLFCSSSLEWSLPCEGRCYTFRIKPGLTQFGGGDN